MLNSKKGSKDDKRFVCYHCGRSMTACVEPKTQDPHWCLRAQSCTKSKGRAEKGKNWSCWSCSVGYRTEVDESRVECFHKQWLPIDLLVVPGAAMEASGHHVVRKAEG